jgi:hypothetical protein
MSFPTVEQRTCIICARKRFDAAVRQVKTHELETIQLIAKLVRSHGPYDKLPGLEDASINSFSQLPLAVAASLSDDLVSFSVCLECWGFIQRSKLPAMALANNMWLGPVPPELQNLTIPEKLLISPVRVKVYIFKLKAPVGPGTEQHAMKGQTIAFPQNVPAIFDALPTPTSSLPDAIKVTCASPVHTKVLCIDPLCRLAKAVSQIARDGQVTAGQPLTGSSGTRVAAAAQPAVQRHQTR